MGEKKSLYFVVVIIVAKNNNKKKKWEKEILHVNVTSEHVS